MSSKRSQTEAIAPEKWQPARGDEVMVVVSEPGFAAFPIRSTVAAADAAAGLVEVWLPVDIHFLELHTQGGICLIHNHEGLISTMRVQLTLVEPTRGDDRGKLALCGSLADMEIVDRRRHRRQAVEISGRFRPISVEGNATERHHTWRERVQEWTTGLQRMSFAAQVRDLSEGGLALCPLSDLPLATRDEVFLRIDLPETRVYAPARVAWTGLPRAGSARHLGLEFVDLEDQARQRIIDFLTTQTCGAAAT